MNINEKISIKENKTLKLSNVLVRELNENEFMDINTVIYMMDSYIKSKGSCKIGPMISYSAVKTDENGQGKIVSKIMFQLKKPIHNIEEPYKYLPTIKVSNCLFARFNEKEENLQFAYSKLNLHAFENDIKLLGESYTIFVDKKDSNIIADVFMEIKNGGDTFANI